MTGKAYSNSQGVVWRSRVNSLSGEKDETDGGFSPAAFAASYAASCLASMAFPANRQEIASIRNVSGPRRKTLDQEYSGQRNYSNSTPGKENLSRTVPDQPTEKRARNVEKTARFMTE